MAQKKEEKNESDYEKLCYFEIFFDFFNIHTEFTSTREFKLTGATVGGASSAERRSAAAHGTTGASIICGLCCGIHHAERSSGAGEVASRVGQA